MPRTPGLNPSPPKRAPIRVLLVDDSLLALAVIAQMLATDPAVQVCGTARSGAEALQLISRLNPDVICLDLHMPGMDGLSFTRELMASRPLPILVLSVAVQREHADTIFEILEAGAVDIVAKPRAGLSQPAAALASELVRKIKVAAGVVALRRRAPVEIVASPGADPVSLAAMPCRPPQIVGLAASTGGPQALEAVLCQLPADFPVPLLCIQHIAEGFIGGLVEWLARKCRIAVLSARDGDVAQAGTAYFAPEGMHLELAADGRLRCAPDRREQLYRPSADLAFRSLARFHGADAAGVVLTGMGRDGVHGLAEIAAAGGVTIAQDKASSAVFGMPGAAIEAAAAKMVVPLAQIGPTLVRLTNPRNGPAAGQLHERTAK